MSNWYHFRSSHVTELPDFRILKEIFVDQLCRSWLGISIPSLKILPRVTDHTRTEKIGGDSIFIFVVIKVVAGNRYDSLATPLGLRELGQY